MVHVLGCDGFGFGIISHTAITIALCQSPACIRIGSYRIRIYSVFNKFLPIPRNSCSDTRLRRISKRQCSDSRFTALDGQCSLIRGVLRYRSSMMYGKG